MSAKSIPVDHDHAGHVHGLIDTHCHVVPNDLPAYPGVTAPDLWPTLSCCTEHQITFAAGPTKRVFDNRSWSSARRIDYMDSHGIALQVLSPLPELLGYWFEPVATLALCRHTNDVLARMVDAHPDRFGALGGLPMNDPALAIEEARRLKTLGFRGVEIGSNINGVSPADPKFSELLTVLEELDLAIFIHGIRPATAGRLIGPAVLEPIVGIPMDTALCLTSFIGTRVLSRLPRLRVGFSHAGGAIGAVIDRFQHIWSVMPELQTPLPESPVEEAKKFYFDFMTFSAQYSRHLIRLLGADRFMVGTDFPAAGMGLMDPAGFLRELDLTPAEQAAVAYGTARRFLNIA